MLKGKEKRYSLAIETMRDLPIDGGQKLKKKGTKTGTICVGWEEKYVPAKIGSWKFCHIFFSLYGKCTGHEQW